MAKSFIFFLYFLGGKRRSKTKKIPNAPHDELGILSMIALQWQ